MFLHRVTKQPVSFETLPAEQRPERPNPATTGIRYMLTKHGCSLRTTWPLPSTAEHAIDTEQGSSEGCRKIRYTYIGHRQRCGLWLSVCMQHHHVIGYHIICHGEGRRDAIYLIYRFMENPPEAMFGDYACGIEETCLNYLPEFFKDVQFFHDVFHGCTHLCSDSFCSRRLNAFAVLNTSLMEQVCFSYLLQKKLPNCLYIVKEILLHTTCS